MACITSYWGCSPFDLEWQHGTTWITMRPHSDDLLNATTKQKVITVAPQSPSLRSYKLLSTALTWQASREKKKSLVIAFLHHSLADMPAPVKLFEQNASQGRPVLWSRLSRLLEIPSHIEWSKKKKAKLCVKAQQKSCLNLVFFFFFTLG